MRRDRGPMSQRLPEAGERIAFRPKWVETTRIDPFCEELPFLTADSFQMTLGDSDDGLRHCVLSIEFGRAVPVGDPIHLEVRSPSRAVLGLPNDGSTSLAIQRAHMRDIEFTFLHGMDASDPGDFDAVSITFLAIPARDGDPLTLRLRIHFTAGQTVDETFASPLACEPCGPVSGSVDSRPMNGPIS
jgi:hypothetical protein